MSASASPVDLALDLGYRDPSGNVNFAVRVAMTWEHAALMHEVLGQALDRARADFGEIRDVQKIQGEGVHVEIHGGE